MNLVVRLFLFDLTIFAKSFVIESKDEVLIRYESNDDPTTPNNDFFEKSLYGQNERFCYRKKKGFRSQ